MRLVTFFFFILPLVAMNTYAVEVTNPCGGASSLLSIIDRPTVGDSACVVPEKHIVIELGFQYQQLTHKGQQFNLPEAELRFGLPYQNEFVVLIPNYIHQSIYPHTGFTAATLGIKHQIGYTSHVVGSVEALYTLPSGSEHFGVNGSGGALNGIVSYTFNPQFNITFMLGVTTQTASTLYGGERYNSINPDFVFTYSPMEYLDFYAEIYGQSHTGPNQASGFNVDSGVVYLMFKNVAVDFEIGQRISGSLNGFKHYVGTGISFYI